MQPKAADNAPRSDTGAWLLLCFVGLLMSLVTGLTYPASADFNQFFAAAKLAGTGHLYSYEAMRETEGDLAKDVVIPFGRIPVYAALFKPLTLLPRTAARLLWLAINAAALTLSFVMWPFRRRLGYTLAVLCWSYPATILLASGEDTALFLLFFVFGTRLMRSGHLFTAGLVYALCANKFHLTAGLVMLVFAARAWKTMLGGACGVIALLGASLAIEGFQWPSQLLALSRVPEFTPAPYKNPNLSGLAYWLPFSLIVECILGIAVLAATYWICRSEKPEIAAAVALMAGLLVGHHAYVYDAILLLPIVILTMDGGFPGYLRIWALLLCLPTTYQFMLAPGTSAPAQFVITGFSLALLACLVARSRPVPALRLP